MSADIKKFYKEHSQRKVISTRMLKIISLVTPYVMGKEIIDVGSGNGFITNCMKLFAKSVYDIDIDDDILVYETDTKYDVVTCFDVFEHLTDVPKAIEQIKKLCNPGGLILINLPIHQDKSQPIDNYVPKESIYGLGNLIYLERHGYNMNEIYNFMVFEC